MHIGETHHEHATSAKVYTYEADYESTGTVVNWTATVSAGPSWRRALEGTIQVSEAAAATVAEEVVRDEIIKQIDAVKGTTP